MSAILNSHLLWDAMWQSTLFLGIGGLLSCGFRQRPSRAHCILLLSLLACLATPVLSHWVRSYNWGLLPEAAIMLPVTDAASEYDREAPTFQQKQIAYSADNSTDTPFPTLPAVTVPPMVAAQPRAGISWLAGFFGFWLFLTAMVLIKVIIGVVQEVRILRNASEIQDRECDILLSEAARKLSIKTEPKVYSSTCIQTPVVCCWGMQPRLIIPRTLLTQYPAMDLGGILCHELAHWKRRDHLTTLMSLIGLALLPWHPLMLWVKRRMSQLSEMSCDHWVLACGYTPETYAESLLKLLPQKSHVAVLPAVSARKNLENRLNSILESRSFRPHVGGKWGWGSIALTIALVSTVAFAKAPVSNTVSAEESNRTSGQSTVNDENVNQNSKRENYPTVLESGYTLRQFPKELVPLWNVSAPTSDGKYATGRCTKNPDANLNVVDLSSGKTLPLTTDGYWPYRYPEESVISPNDKTVAFNWMISSTTEPSKCQLRIVDIDGANSRTILSDDNIEYIDICHWTPESNALLCQIWRQGQKECEVTLLSLSDGVQSILLRSENGSSFQLTPDRQEILFTDLKNDNDDIVSYSISDRTLSPIISESSNDRLVGLSLDAKWIVFTSNRLGTVDLWVQTWSNVPSEKANPILVKKNIGDIILSRLNSRGGFYYTEQLCFSDIYCADVDWNAHEIKEWPVAISASIKATNKGKGRWSPRGDEIAFEVGDEAGTTLRIFSLTNQQLRSIPGILKWRDWTWSIDGRYFYAFGTPKGGELGIYRIDPGTGDLQTVVTDPAMNFLGFYSCPDIETLYNYVVKKPNHIQILAYDVGTKNQKLLYEYSDPNVEQCTHYKFHKSPDGKWLLVYRWVNNNEGYIRLISTETGEFKDLYKDESWKIQCMTWLPDSHNIVFIDPEEVDHKIWHVLWKINIDNGRLDRVWTFDSTVTITEMQVGPSGDKIFYSKFQNEFRYNGLENFLPNL